MPAAGSLVVDKTADQCEPLLLRPSEEESLFSSYAGVDEEVEAEEKLVTSTGGRLDFSTTSQKKSPTGSLFWFGSMKPHCRIFLYFVALMSITFLLYVTLSRDSSLPTSFEHHKTGHDDGGEKSEKGTYVKRKRVRLEIYMESQCPDTTKFIDSQLIPIFKELGEDYINLTFIPFGKAKWTRLPTEEEDYSFQCQHGPRECAVNQLMCCGIERLKSSTEKYLQYVACLQGTSPGAKEQAKCDENAHLSHKEMQECADGREGRVLHQKMGVRTKQLQPQPTFIPWIVVEGIREKQAFTDLKTVLCEKLWSKLRLKPKPCEDVLLSNKAVL